MTYCWINGMIASYCSWGKTRETVSHVQTYPTTGQQTTEIQCMSSGFHREVDENCTLLGHYATSR